MTRHTLSALASVVALYLAGCSRPSAPDSAYSPTAPLVVTIWVTGSSMQPTLPDGHWARIDIGYPYERLAVGDIVLLWDYQRKGWTLHRLIARQGPWWISRGDNPETNLAEDGPFVRWENYRGKYTAGRT